MADITIDAVGDARSGHAPRALVYTTPLIGYFFYVEVDASFVYRKTTDGGATWAAAVKILDAASDTAMACDIWFDKWTPGDAGTKIHTAYITDNADDVYYRALDTADDSLGTQATIFAGTSAANVFGTTVTLAKARGGNLLCAFNIDGGTEVGTAKSTDGGANWSAVTSMAEAGTDLMIMFPGGEADNQDMWMLYHDVSANALTLKAYDDSANAVAESATIVTAVSFATLQRTEHQFQGAIRHSDNHLICAVWTERDSATGDLRVFDLNGTASITEKTALATDKDDSYFPCVHVNSADHIYVGYVGKLDGTETTEVDWQVYYALSTDGGATWASTNNAYSAAGSDWEQAWCSLNGPRFAIAWRRFTGPSFHTNVDNAVNHVPTLSSVTPSSGSASGGTAVTIAGANFSGTTGVTFGGTAATDVVVVSDLSITCTTPAHAAGAVSVLVTNATGANSANTAYTYNAVAANMQPARFGFNFGFGF